MTNRVVVVITQHQRNMLVHALQCATGEFQDTICGVANADAIRLLRSNVRELVRMLVESPEVLSCPELVSKPCPACVGNGMVFVNGNAKWCEGCGGSGQLISVCQLCHGYGKVIGTTALTPCGNCAGLGFITRTVATGLNDVHDGDARHPENSTRKG